MRTKALGRDLRRSIFKTLGRFLAIFAIIALGSGFLAGLRCTKAAMIATMQKNVDDLAMFDMRVLNTYGFTQSDADALSAFTGAKAEGGVSADALVNIPGREDASAARFFSLPEQVSLPELTAGRMPEKPGECLADTYFFKPEDLGSQITLAKENEEGTTDMFAQESFTVVGLCRSPLFMNFERGSTTVGKGVLNTYLYVPMEAFHTDGVFTEINIKLPENYPIYSQEYDDRLKELSDSLEPKVEELAQNRLASLKLEAQEELDQGWEEYREGVKTLEEEKANALKELDDARKKLDEGWKTWESGKAQFDDGKAQLTAARKKLDDAQRQISSGYRELEEKEISVFQEIDHMEKELLDKKQQIQDGLPQITDGIAQIDEGLKQIEDGLKQLDLVILPLQGALVASREELSLVEKGLENTPDDPALLSRKAALEAQISQLETQLEGLQEKRAGIVQQQTDLEEKRSQLVSQKQQLEDGLLQIEEGLEQIPAAKQQARQELDKARKDLDSAKAQTEQGLSTLQQKTRELNQAELDLETGKKELEQGEKDYEDGYNEAMTALADGEKELSDGKKELEEGQKELDDLKAPEYYLLDRNTNIAYVSFDSDSSIVEGVARVFPLFFFAVAALVCLTTMSKMVDEERTQIGVKKALGYSSFAISRKYLAYAGFATLAGCVVGVTAGSFLFPAAIWQGYKILYQFSPGVVAAMDVPMCMVIVVAFTALMLLVTWNCCRRELEEVPAELIRPKAPKAGKHLLLEKMFFWKRLSFLRKVSIRNVFRYHKRLAMMLLGVGGCTAMLVTGYGLKDTISDIADYQFDHISVYDAAVTFGNDQTPEAQETFRENLKDHVEGALFLHEQPMDIIFEDNTKALQMMVSQEPMEGFWIIGDDEGSLPLPKEGEVLLNEGIAQRMGIEVGSTVTLRSTELKTLELKVAGIFSNYVSNYAIVSPETIEKQWGETPSVNGAYLNFTENASSHEASAQVFKQKDVLNVMPTQDLRMRVDNMMVSLDYIVALVVACAAALAFIVMYNLTNINITERIREIATIKVLGFYSGESALYVFREGMFLTAMGCALGLVAGKFLNDFVIGQIKIDMVHFIPRVSWVSYLLAAGLTFLFALAVDLVLYVKLEKINMAEALKSVE